VKRLQEIACSGVSLGDHLAIILLRKVRGRNIMMQGVRNFFRRIPVVHYLGRELLDLRLKITGGYFVLEKQRDLLLNSGWNVLIILDACRADFFQEVEPNCESVWSMASYTRAWVKAFGAVLAEMDLDSPVLWFAANPVVDRDVEVFKMGGTATVPLWQTCWDEHGPDHVPGVHPRDVNQAVLNYVAEHGQPERMIVHYMQPHAPYLGATRLSVPGQGTECRGLLVEEIPVAVKEGLISNSDLRRAYTDNLALVWEYAKRLRSQLRGKIAVTGDHGELLGEGGLYSHESFLRRPELWIVPWVCHDHGVFTPSKVVDIWQQPQDERLLEERLQAFGYV